LRGDILTNLNKPEERDITKYINAKLTNIGIVLFYNKQPIGKIAWENITNVNLNNKKFIFKDNKLILLEDYPIVSQYAENCDLGWF
jgi:hypothetical protein